LQTLLCCNDLKFESLHLFFIYNIPTSQLKDHGFESPKIHATILETVDTDI